MGEPTWLHSGTVPQITSTRRILWAKKLATIRRNNGDTNPKNAPGFTDTVTRLKFKCVQSAKGGGSGGGNNPVFNNVQHVWHLGEASGNPRADSVGSLTFNETSGVVNSAAGIHGNCAHFTAAGAFLKTASFAFVKPFTIALWVKYAAGHTYDTTDSLINDSHSIIIVVDNTGILNFFANAGNVQSSTTLVDDDWTFIVCRVAADGTTAISVNGSTFENGTLEGADPAPSPIGIGGVSDPATPFIDELMIWNVALTQGNVTTLWNGGAGTFYSP